MADAAASAFERMSLEFQTRLNQLKAITLLRVEDSTLDSHAEELGALEATVRALEEQLQAVWAHIQREKQALPQMEAVLRAYHGQHAQLQYMADNLPPYLPGTASQTVTATGSAEASTATAAMGGRSGHAEDAAGGDENAPLNASRPGSAEGGGAERKKRPPAPRRYVTQDELGSLSSYMTARLSLDKVNAAVDDAASLAEGVARSLAAARARGSKLAPAERKRAQMLAVNVQNKEGVKGHHWFMDADMKGAHVLKLDKTGKALLTVLRHLGRLQELRLNVEGSMQPVYIVH